MSMNVPKLRFKEFVNEWKFSPIGDILRIKSGFGFKASEYCDSGAKLLQIENVGYGKINWNKNNCLPFDYLDEYPELHLKENDIVIALNRPVTNDQLKISKLTQNDEPSILYQRVGKLSFIGEFAQPDYIYQVFINYVKNFVLKQAIGSDQPFISITALYKYKIPLPSLPEQTKIANFLTAIDEKITQLTQKHDLLKQYKKGVMQQIFSQKLRFKDDDGGEFPGWEVKRLNELSLLITKGTTPSSVGHSYINKGINFIKIEALDLNGNFLKKKFAFIDSNAHEKLKRSQLESDDILFSIAGALGRVAIVKDEFLPANTNQALAIIRLNQTKNINIKYVYFALISDGVQKLIESISVQLAQANLSLKDISNLVIQVPHIQEQTKIANFLTAIDDKITHTQVQLEAVKQYKKGLLQQMFV